MKRPLLRLLLPAGGLGLAALLLAPAGTGFTLAGHSLGLAQRDFRVFDNFADPEANDNQTPHPNFPGYLGATVAVWKAAVEWGSELHGDGTGDPYGGNLLGSGGANFDLSFQGGAGSVGGASDNVLSELSGSGGGVLAFAEGPFADGWRVRFYSDPWTWQDGPGDDGESDLQGVTVRMFGLCLGLGPSQVAGASMNPSTSPSVELRSIEADDSAGVQAIYGVAAPDKPRILDTSLDLGTGILTITGEDFGPTGNAVWFSRGTPGGDGTPVQVTGLASTGGGTTIVVAVPPDAGPGDVLVLRGDASGGADLSNAWPFDPTITGLGDVGVSGVAPASLDAVVVDGFPTVTLSGFGFLGVDAVEVDGIALSPADFAVVGDGRIDVTGFPYVTQLGPVEVRVSGTTGTAATTITMTPPDPPNLQLAGSLSEGGTVSSAAGLDLALGGEPGDLHLLAFSGSALPSVLPGVVALDIGNGFLALFGLGSWPIPASGSLELLLPVTGDLTGVTVHLQSAVLEAGAVPPLPLTATNVQSALFGP